MTPRLNKKSPSEMRSIEARKRVSALVSTIIKLSKQLVVEKKHTGKPNPATYRLTIQKLQELGSAAKAL